jgi:CRISPR/Cas system CSM-associated protein Csm3 (group 7 of RAMP superfamily)
MKDLQLEITLDSDALVGSGESYGSIIDGDVVFELNGLPYIPAKRIKGCLRDAAEEILFLFGKADPNYKIKIINEIDLEACFGQRYSDEKNDTKEEKEFRGKSGKVYYNNLMLSG